MRPMLFITALLTIAAGPVWGHELQSEVTRGSAVVVRIFDDDGDAFAGGSYELYAEGESAPFQAGRTDGLGRVAFVPDRAGAWRLKVFSEDGHGIVVSVDADASDLLSVVQRPWLERHAGAVVGVALLFGAFGVLSLFLGKRTG